MDPGLRKIFNYFAHFRYVPTLWELYIFYPRRLKHEEFISLIDLCIKVESNKRIRRQNEYIFNYWTDTSTFRYTLGEYTNLNTHEKIATSRLKIMSIRVVIGILKIFPQIKMIGISGSVAMRNADSGDDIDLFIITAKNRLWTARLACLIVTSILRLRRSRGSAKVKDKICLNLFFDESEMTLPSFKQTEYGAHEVLQMKPMFVRGSTYVDFLSENNWVYNYFPNAVSHFENVESRHNRSFRKTPVRLGSLLVGVATFFTDISEFAAKQLQMKIMQKYKTREIIGERQLWFFPDDYEQKIMKHF